MEPAARAQSAGAGAGAEDEERQRGFRSPTRRAESNELKGHRRAAPMGGITRGGPLEGSSDLKRTATPSVASAVSIILRAVLREERNYVHRTRC